MKRLLTATAITLLSALPASAIEFNTPVARTPAAQPLYTCSTGAVSRVALQAAPAPCCEGQFHCPKFLSTEGLVRPKQNRRT